jgi:L-asparaginase
MAPRRVAIGGMGGTIAMTNTVGTGAVPTLSAAELVDAVPGLADVAEVTTTNLASKPGASLTEADMMRSLAWARTEVDAGACGVVLVQGTDTLEETAYLLDLFWDRSEPLIVTGAMRAPEQAGSDGSANILASVLTAIEPSAGGRGVLVVLNDQVHEAAWVSKSDSMSVNAFRSPVFGPIGRLVEGGVVFRGRSRRHPPLAGDQGTATSSPRVGLLTTHLADSGEVLRLVVEAGFDGVVIGSFGVGHVSSSLADVVGEATPVCPVVFASRTGSGTTAKRTYGFPGSERDLCQRGAIAAGWLTSVKARVLLWASLRLGFTTKEIEAEFARRGVDPWQPEGT